jgi:hypothetical protein
MAVTRVARSGRGLPPGVPLLPVAGPAFGMGYRNNLEAGTGEAINQAKGETGEDKAAGVWGKRGHRWGTAATRSTVCDSSAMKARATGRLRAAYQSRAASASASAAGCNSIFRRAMALLPKPGFHCLPRNGRDAPRIQLWHSAGHFRLPSGLMISIRFDFQALQEQPGQDGPVFLSKTQGLLDPVWGSAFMVSATPLFFKLSLGYRVTRFFSSVNRSLGDVPLAGPPGAGRCKSGRAGRCGWLRP